MKFLFQLLFLIPLMLAGTAAGADIDAQLREIDRSIRVRDYSQAVQLLKPLIRADQAEALFRKEASTKTKLREVKFKTLTSRIKAATDVFIHSHNWQTYGLLGFTISLCQLTSALYVIKRIKKTFPDLIIVVGGASTPATAAPGILKEFPEVDMVVNGEGEIPLYQIIDHLKKTPPDLNLSKIQGVFTRLSDPEQPDRASFSQLNALDELTAPDYDHYFELINTFDTHKSFFPTLPVETSRGCWWKGAVGPARVTGCAFCNLNLQWDGYRSNPAAQVAAEIDYLTSRHRTLSVAIMDNVLPKKKRRRTVQTDCRAP